MNPDEFLAQITEAIKKAVTPEPAPAPAPDPVQKGLSAEDVQKILVASFGEFSKQIDAKIEKATTFSRDGVGRTGQVVPGDERDADPLKYIVKKAAGDHLDFDITDRALAAEIFTRALKEGMIYGSDNE